jgi:hypothetical protein
MLITGYVERVTNKNGIWAVVVDNIRYGFYKTEPKCKEGDYVSFEADQKGDFWNAKPPTLKRAVAPADAPKPYGASDSIPSTPGVANTAPAKAAWVPDKDRQDSIIYQSARKDGLEFVSTLIAAGLIDFGKAKVADKIGIAEMYVDKYTLRFFEDTKRLSPPASTVGETAAPAAKAATPVNSDASFQDDDLSDLPF